MTSERKLNSRSTNAMPSTNANTIGRCESTTALKSAVPAVWPVTPAVTPRTAPRVTGTSARSRRSAATERASVPVPVRGIAIVSTRWSALCSTVSGFSSPRVCSARAISRAAPCCTAPARTSGAIRPT
jgi:hypothetical protein